MGKVDRFARWLRPLPVFVAIAMVGVVFAIVLLYRANHEATLRNRELIRQHAVVDRRSLNTLKYVCSALSRADVFVVQMVADRMIDERQLHGRELERSRNLTSTLNVLHLYLNDRRACDEVTG